MKKTMEWITLILLGALTLFETLILCLGQFGTNFTQGGPEPRGLQFGWLVLICKIVGLGISRRTGLLMLAAGLFNWLYSVIFIQMQAQHQSFSVALSKSPLDGAYLILVLLYIVVSGRWWVTTTSSGSAEMSKH